MSFSCKFDSLQIPSISNMFRSVGHPAAASWFKLPQPRDTIITLHKIYGGAGESGAAQLVVMTGGSPGGPPQGWTELPLAVLCGVTLPPSTNGAFRVSDLLQRINGLPQGTHTLAVMPPLGLYVFVHASPHRRGSSSTFMRHLYTLTHCSS